MTYRLPPEPDELNLPVFPEPLPSPPPPSMDSYDAWIEEHLRSVDPAEVARRCPLPWNVPFRIVD